MKAIYIRASSVKGTLYCPSFGVTDNPWNPKSAPAEQGTAAHSASQFYLDSEGEIPDFPLIQLKHPMTDIEDLRMCFWMFKKMWDEHLEPMMGKDFATEVEMKARLGIVEIDGEEMEVYLTGHADIVAQTKNDLIVWDWKFGRLTGNSHFAQTASYAALAVANYGWPDSGVVTVGEAYPRLGLWKDHTQKLDKVYLGEFKNTILEAVKQRGRIRTPTVEGCKFCSARHECPEYPRLFKDSFLAVQSIVEGDSSVVDPEELAHLHSAYKSLEYATNSFKKLFQTALESSGAVGKDKAIEGFYLSETTRRAVAPRTAWALLVKVLSQDELSSILSLSFAKVKKAVMGKTPEGMKKKEFWEEFEKSLYEAHAVHEKTSLSVTKM